MARLNEALIKDVYLSMKDLSKIMQDIKGFAESHRMVEDYKFIESVDILDRMQLKYRTLATLISGVRMSRTDGNPIYETDILVFMFDKAIAGEDDSVISSMQENLFVLSQLQDFLQQEGEYDFELSGVDQQPLISNENEHITGLSATLTIIADRSIYIKELNKE